MEQAKSTAKLNGNAGTRTPGSKKVSMSGSFQLEGNLSGVGVRTGGQYTEPATGAYRVTVTEVTPYEKDGAINSVRFQTVIADGEFAGSEIRVFIGTDLSKAGNQKSWRTALISCGKSAAQVDTLKTWGDSDFLNKTAFIYYKAKNPDDATAQADKFFITPDAFANHTGNAAGASKAAAVSVSAPAMNVAKPNGAGVRGILNR